MMSASKRRTVNGSPALFHFMATLFKRNNGVWYIVYRDGSRRRWQSTGYRNEECARQMFEESRKGLERSRYITIQEFASEFQIYAHTNLAEGTRNLYDICFRHLESVIGNKALRTISPFDVESYKSKRLEKVSRVRVNIEFRTLKAALTKAVAWGYIPSNPFKLSRTLSVPASDPVYLTKNEFRTLLSIIPDEEFKNLLIFAVSTMMRIGEILALEWDDIDLNQRLIHVRHKEGFTVKGGKERTIPMSERIYYLLVAKERKGSKVFAKADGSPRSTKVVSRRFKHYVIRCGLSKKIHFHSLRHTGASWLVQEGVPLFAVQNVLGHSSPQVTQIYSHLDQKSLKSAVEKISWN